MLLFQMLLSPVLVLYKVSSFTAHYYAMTVSESLSEQDEDACFNVGKHVVIRAIHQTRMAVEHRS
jgi:hypothetical protein